MFSVLSSSIMISCEGARDCRMSKRVFCGGIGGGGSLLKGPTEKAEPRLKIFEAVGSTTATTEGVEARKNLSAQVPPNRLGTARESMTCLCEEVGPVTEADFSLPLFPKPKGVSSFSPGLAERRAAYPGCRGFSPISPMM